MLTLAQKGLQTLCFTGLGFLVGYPTASTNLPDDPMIKDFIRQLEKDEGFRAKPYQDSAGVWTIGHGLTYLTKDESAAIVAMRLDDIQDRLNRERWYRKLSDKRKDVIIQMVYNLGFYGVCQFVNMIDAIDREDWNSAADEMLNSKWAEQVGKRAKRLAKQMRRG